MVPSNSNLPILWKYILYLAIFYAWDWLNALASFLGKFEYESSPKFPGNPRIQIFTK